VPEVCLTPIYKLKSNVRQQGVCHATFQVHALGATGNSCFSPIPAIADYACSVAEIFECTAVTGCQRVSGEQANLPPFVTLNVRQRTLLSGLFGGQGLFEPGDAYEMKMCSSSTEGTNSSLGLRSWPRTPVKCRCRSQIWVGTYAEFGNCTPQQ
jgi:hypothetical protein